MHSASVPLAAVGASPQRGRNVQPVQLRVTASGSPLESAGAGRSRRIKEIAWQSS
jgi:hypothetical protein